MSLMSTGHLQSLVAQVQTALGIDVPCGTITLNMNEALVQSVRVETHVRILKVPLDRREAPRHS